LRKKKQLFLAPSDVSNLIQTTLID